MQNEIVWSGHSCPRMEVFNLEPWTEEARGQECPLHTVKSAQSKAHMVKRRTQFFILERAIAKGNLPVF